MAIGYGVALFMLFLVRALCDDDATETQLFQDINQYRGTIGAPLLVVNPGAHCLAEKLADKFEQQPCNTVTEAQTSAGLEPNFPDYPAMLQDCKLQVANTSGGQVLVDCIPNALLSSAAATATQNFTNSQEYQQYINSTVYTSIGIASEDLWFVLVLATKSPDGNFAQVSAAPAIASCSSWFIALAVLIAVSLVRF